MLTKSAFDVLIFCQTSFAACSFGEAVPHTNKVGGVTVPLLSCAATPEYMYIPSGRNGSELIGMARKQDGGYKRLYYALAQKIVKIACQQHKLAKCNQPKREFVLSFFLCFFQTLTGNKVVDKVGL